MDGEYALLFKKNYAGRDGFGREGRYLVHFLVAHVTSLTVTDLLRISPQFWLTDEQVPLDTTPKLADVSIRDVSLAFLDYEVTDLRDARVVARAAKLAQKGKVDVADLGHSEIAAVLSCLPPWVDSGATLVPEWRDGRPIATLSINNSFQLREVADHRVSPPSPAVANACNDLSRLGSEPAKPSPRHSQAAATRPDQVVDRPPYDPADFKVLVGRWLSEGSQSLSLLEKALLQRKAEGALSLASHLNGRIPFRGGRPDDLAVHILNQCGAPDFYQPVKKVLPASDSDVSALTHAAPVSSLLLAVFATNMEPRRKVEIRVRSRLTDSIIREVTAACRNDSGLSAGLAASVRISFYGKSSFCRALLTHPSTDYDWLFSSILPQAFAGEDDALLAVVGLNGERFVDWLGVHTEYRTALATAIPELAPSVLRRKMSGFRSRLNPR
ncbi:hypothetical protein AB0873_10955 [Micromonospora sp. NPDC047707]|uniref:hypothetical protein n=1 Tax=Micromonospora sp. NPDC047707 TaxID=3154498 RepID=UPI0034573469